MYNKEIKERFINSLQINSQVPSILFNQIATIEEKHEQDVYYLPYDTIIPEVLDVMDIVSYDTFYNNMLYVKKYKQWCMIEDVFDRDVPMNLSSLTSKSLRNYYREHMGTVSIKSFTQLHHHLDSIFGDAKNESDYMSLEEVQKMVYLLLFHGISDEIVFKLTTENVIVAQNGLFIKYDELIIQIIDEELQKLLEKRLRVGRYGYNRATRFTYASMGNLLISFGGNNKDIRGHVTSNTSRAIRESKKKLDLKPRRIYFYGVINIIKMHDEINNVSTKRKDLNEWFEVKYGAKLNRSEKRTIREIYMAW